MIFRQPYLLAQYFLLAVFAKAEEAKGNVVSINSKDVFEQLVNSNDLSMIKFYAPWCGHCQKLAPVYEEAAGVIKSKLEKVTLAEIDCTEENNKAVCEEQKIQGYPTLKVFHNGNEIPYEGARQSDAIVKFLTKQTMPAVVEITDLDAFVASDSLVVIAYPSNAEQEKEFEELAKKHKNDFTFGKVTKAVSYDSKDIKQGTVTVIKNFDNKFSTYEGEFSSNNIEKWLANESFPIMAELGPENYGKYVKDGTPMFYLFYGDDEQKAKFSELCAEALKDFKGTVRGVSIDAKVYERHAEALAITHKNWPAVVIHTLEGNIKYPFHGEVSSDSLKAYLAAFKDGSLNPEYRSEEIPTENNEPIKVVVNKSWDSIINDNSKDVLVKLYAPWCGACKRIAPEYEKLAALYEGQQGKVVFAKMDATNNDLPASSKITLRKFPTFVLYPAGKKDSPIEMIEPAAGLEDLAKFVLKNAANKIEEVAIPENNASEATEEVNEEL